jgi:hypothetical protein
VTTDDTLEIMAAEAVLGLGDAERLTRGAVGLLTAGFDSRALVELAGLSGADTGEARVLRDRALGEMSVAVPNPREATIRLARELARKIVDGSLPPYDGAERIWDLTLRINPERIHELDPFVYAASEWRSRPGDRPFFESAIVSEARALLDR